MFKKADIKLSKLVLITIIIVQSVLVILFPPKNIISYDAFGYYLYLPQKFIYNDLDFKDEKRIYTILNEYKASENFYQAFKASKTGKYVIKYSCGMAIFYSPFFFLAHNYTKYFSDYKADGFSKPYQFFLLYGCLFYSILGFYYLRKLLLVFYNEKITSLSMLTIFLCTNYLAHIPLSGQGAMSHNILFTLYAMTGYYTIKWYRSFEVKHIIILAICIGLAALVRPTEILLATIPLLYSLKKLNEAKSHFNELKKHITQILLGVLIIFLLGSIQLIYFKIYAGKFLYNSYGGNPGEGFEFLHPNILEVLFSFRKGWLIYSPIIILFVSGLFLREVAYKEFKLTIIVFFGLSFYIISCWSCWWYAGSFGQRPLIPILSLLSLPLAEILQTSEKTKFRYFVYSFIPLTAMLNIFQTWQLTNNIIDSDRMTRSYYFSVFGQTTSPSEEQKKLLFIERSTSLQDDISKTDWSSHVAIKKESLRTDTCKNQSLLAEYNTSYLTVKEQSYSPMLRYKYNQLSDKYYLWVKASVKYYNFKADTAMDVILRVAMEHKGYEYKLRRKTGTTTDYLTPGWHKLEFYYLTPEIRVKSDNLRIYVENDSDNKILLDSLQVEIFEPKVNLSVF